jgi:hypothetical protein
MGDDERMALARRDDAFREALLEGAPWMTGLSSSQHDVLREEALRKRHGARIDELDASIEAGRIALKTHDVIERALHNECERSPSQSPRSSRRSRRRIRAGSCSRSRNRMRGFRMMRKPRVGKETHAMATQYPIKSNYNEANRPRRGPRTASDFFIAIAYRSRNNASLFPHHGPRHIAKNGRIS